MTLEIEALRAVGLTDYGARAYEALVRLGPCSAVAVANASTVPATKVYTVLADLEDRGWVESDEGRPKTFRARSPKECIERAHAQLSSLLEAATPRLQTEFDKGIQRHASPFWILHGHASVSEKALEMVRRARREILLASAFTLGADEALGRALVAAHKRGVAVRATLGTATTPLARALAGSPIETRVAAMPVWLLVVDETQVLVGYITLGANGIDDVTAIWHPSGEVSKLLGSVFPRLWRDAANAPISER